MDIEIRSVLAKLAWRETRKLKPFFSRRPVILEYHGIPKVGHDGEIDSSVFEKHIAFLKQHYEIVPGTMLWERRKPFDKVRVVLTFDDGFRNHAEVLAPILRRYGIPAIFFVCSRHAIPGKYLWFTYLHALETYFRGNGFYFRGEFIKMSSSHRPRTVQRLREYLLNLTPHPRAMYEAIEKELPPLEDFVCDDDLRNHYAGMTSEQLGELGSDSLFTIGSHTVDHPFLTRCEREEVARQILQNKIWIEQASNQKCDTIAYPGGDYNLDVLEQCRALNFTHGYVETPSVGKIPELELPRVGIYSISLDVLGSKVYWGKAYAHLMKQRALLTRACSFFMARSIRTGL